MVAPLGEAIKKVAQAVRYFRTFQLPQGIRAQYWNTYLVAKLIHSLFHTLPTRKGIQAIEKQQRQLMNISRGIFYYGPSMETWAKTMRDGGINLKRIEPLWYKLGGLWSRIQQGASYCPPLWKPVLAEWSERWAKITQPQVKDPGTSLDEKWQLWARLWSVHQALKTPGWAVDTLWRFNFRWSTTREDKVRHMDVVELLPCNLCQKRSIAGITHATECTGFHRKFPTAHLFKKEETKSWARTIGEECWRIEEEGEERQTHLKRVLAVAQTLAWIEKEQPRPRRKALIRPRQKAKHAAPLPRRPATVQTTPRTSPNRNPTTRNSVPRPGSRKRTRSEDEAPTTASDEPPRRRQHPTQQSPSQLPQPIPESYITVSHPAPTATAVLRRPARSLQEWLRGRFSPGEESAPKRRKVGDERDK